MKKRRRRALKRSQAYDIERWPPERVERFWAKVALGDDEEVWPWTGRRGRVAAPPQYTYTESGRQLYPYAPRLAWTFLRGPVAAKLEVFHRCLRLDCCNPAHLAVGTARQRCGMMPARGRSLAGERHPGAKLTAAQVGELLELKRAQPQRATNWRSASVSARSRGST